MTDIYKAFRRARKQGFTFNGACSVVAREFSTSERRVRIIAVRHGLYA
jgi:hypothetical protein